MMKNTLSENIYFSIFQLYMYTQVQVCIWMLYPCFVNCTRAQHQESLQLFITVETTTVKIAVYKKQNFY